MRDCQATTNGKEKKCKAGFLAGPLRSELDWLAGAKPREGTSGLHCGVKLSITAGSCLNTDSNTVTELRTLPGLGTVAKTPASP